MYCFCLLVIRCHFCVLHLEVLCLLPRARSARCCTSFHKQHEVASCCRLSQGSYFGPFLCLLYCVSSDVCCAAEWLQSSSTEQAAAFQCAECHGPSTVAPRLAPFVLGFRTAASCFSFMARGCLVAP